MSFMRENTKKNRRLKGRARKPAEGPGLLLRLRRGGLAALGRLCRFTLLTAAVALSLGLVSALLIGGYLYVSNTDYFAVRKVTISGLERIDHETALAATGLDEPANILTFDLDEAREALTALPWLESAEINRVMPDAIEIQVTEYHPRALVNLGSLYYMDDQGRPFKLMEPGENPDLPIVSGFSGDELLSPGQGTRAALAEVFWLIAALAVRSDEFQLDNVSEVAYDPARGLTVFTRLSGLQIKVGFGAYEEKFRRLARVMAHLKLQNQNENLVYINIENSPRVTVRHGDPAPAPRAKGA